MRDMAPRPRIVLLAGGVGGARMALGLSAVLPAGALSIVANVGDDQRFYGLKVCPDIDTILYTLSATVDTAQGWGVQGDTTRVLEKLAALGAPTWMKLGDADFALHIYRTWRIAEGDRLTDVIADVAIKLGLQSKLLPATDDTACTEIDTSGGRLKFQDWFVALRCAPKVQRVHCARSAAPTPEVLDAIRNADIIVIAPSNPLLSIEPMLALPGLRESLENRRVPCVAVSPLIGGRAVKGPLDKMLADLNLRGGNAGLADRYARLIDGMVIDRSDACDVDGLHDRGLAVLTAPTLIRERGPAHYLAARVLDWAERLRLGVVAGVQP